MAGGVAQLAGPLGVDDVTDLELKVRAPNLMLKSEPTGRTTVPGSGRWVVVSCFEARRRSSMSSTGLPRGVPGMHLFGASKREASIGKELAVTKP